MSRDKVLGQELTNHMWVEIDLPTKTIASGVVPKFALEILGTDNDDATGNFMLELVIKHEEGQFAR